MSDLQSQRAAEELALIEEARARTARTAQAPLWADAACAVMLATALALALTRSLIPGILAAVLFIGGLLLGNHFTRRKGRPLDEHATKAHMGRYFLFMFPVMFTGNMLLLGRPLWGLVTFGVFAAAMMFAYLRLESRYLARCLAKGDYKPGT